MRSRKSGRRPQGVSAALLLGVIFTGVLLAALLLLAFAYEREVLPQGREWPICMGILGLISFCCAFTAGRRENHARMKYSLCSTLLILLFFVTIGVFTKGPVISNISFWSGLGIVISGGILGGICASLGKNRFRKTRI